MIFFTSDWHFNHIKSFLYEPRGFSNIEDMNEAVIERHNSVVNSDDDVYCLGDILMSVKDSNPAQNIKLIGRLNGKLHFLRGNHDTDKKLLLYKECPNVVECDKYADILKYKKYIFYLSHYPTSVGNLDDEITHKKRYCLCGHSHTFDRWQDFKNMKAIHVEMETNNCYPTCIDEIIEQIKQKIDT